MNVITDKFNFLNQLGGASCLTKTALVEVIFNYFSKLILQNIYIPTLYKEDLLCIVAVVCNFPLKSYYSF